MHITTFFRLRLFFSEDYTQAYNIFSVVQIHICYKTRIFDGTGNERFDCEVKVTTLKMKNSAFTEEELAYVTRQFGKGKYPTEIRRAFRKKFCPNNPAKIPHAKAFVRVMDRLKNRGSAQVFESLSEETVQRVKYFFIQNGRSHIREASNVLNLSVGMVWNVLRKKLYL